LQADNVVHIFGGVNYTGASLTLKILSLYPLLLTFSALSGSVIYATERTYIFRNLAFILTPIGTLISVLLISPFAGLNFGAVGLCIKHMTIEFISVVIILFLNSRYLKISFKKYFLHLIYVPAIFLVCAGASSSLINLLFVEPIGAALGILIPGIVYSAMFIALIYFYPILIFKERSEVVSSVQILWKKMRIRGNAQ